MNGKWLFRYILVFIFSLNFLMGSNISIEQKTVGLYVAYFDRAPDQEGFNYWSNRAKNSSDSSKILKELSAGFSQHPTFVSTYSSLDNRAFVEKIYQNCLGNLGDSEGITYWTNYLDSRNSRSDMVSDFIELSLTLDLTKDNFPNLTDEELKVAQERQDLILNKVEVGLKFIDLLGNKTNVVNSQNPENDPAYKASIKILEGITIDKETVNEKIQFLNDIKNDDNPIEKIIGVSPTATPTPTITKTRGYLIDSPVEGVEYICSDGSKGITDFNGTFECIDAPITFKIGNLTLGTLTAFTTDSKVYPQDLLGIPRNNFTYDGLKLLARLFQSLDDDGDIETKITITKEIREKINIDRNIRTIREDEVKSLVESVGKTLVKECGALKHLGADVSCNSDGSYYVYTPPVSGGGNNPPVAPIKKLSNSTIVYSSSPVLNQEFNITIEGNNETTKTSKMQQKEGNPYTWSVVSQPDGSNLVLTPSVDGKSVTCTPSVAGKYVLKVSQNNEFKEVEFFINKEYTVDSSKIEGYDGTQDLSKVEGMVKNQIWVYSNSLTQSEIEVIVAKYSIFTVIDFDEVLGLLVQFDETDPMLQENIEKLKLESGIDSLDYRYYEGNDVAKDEEKIADDGSAFNDGGDNWHLEYIHIDKAWDMTTGNKDFLIGITDGNSGNFHSKHEDLKGRFSSVINTNDSSIGTHGTEVAGAIGAISNNKKGMSGINWITQLVGERSSLNGLKKVFANEKVLLSSNSWALPGYLPKDFNLIDKNMTKNRIDKVLKETRQYRKLAENKKYNKKLFVFSAGNGVGNGSSTSGFYGVDGKYHSPTLHYNKDGTLNKQNNVIFVAALLNDSRLAYYSNFGESVDIAAPTQYKSTKSSPNIYADSLPYGTNKYGGFGGTSAAAPVVSGVASLIFSLNKDFTGADVKSILIKSSTDTVKERYTKPNKTSTIKLAHEIPILNAESALKMAKDIVDGKVAKVIHRFDDAFKPEATILVSSANNELKTISFDYELYGITSTVSEGITSGKVDNGNILKIHLDEKYTGYHIQGLQNGVEFKHEKTGITTQGTYNYDFIVPKTTLTIQDSISLKAIPNASVEIEPMFCSATIIKMKKTGTVDEKGKANLYLLPGQYKFIVSSDDYETKSTKIVNISKEKTNSIEINMGDVGNLGGKILDMTGKPIVGAIVRLSGGEQTNGFVYADTTDSSGTYNISNISKKDSNGKPITSFTLSATATGYKEGIKEDIVIIYSGSVNYNLILEEKDPTTETVIYSTSFEYNENSWTGTGLWHTQELKTETSVVNTLVDNGFVTLPPDEGSEHAYLPKAYDGDSVMWYGLSDTGSFINTQQDGDNLKSGGTSTSAHSGTITSPSIDLSSATQPILRFQTWWEIESVNPNENGFDIMDIKISVDDGEFVTVRRLNPHVDPNIDDRASKCFSSAGVFRKPVWVIEELILSEYVGHSIRIQFSFDTKDGLYNGFRGWIIDNLSVIEGTVSSNSGSNKMSKIYQKSDTKTTSIFDGLSEEYIRVHKKPQKIEESKTSTR